MTRNGEEGVEIRINGFRLEDCNGRVIIDTRPRIGVIDLQLFQPRVCYICVTTPSSLLIQATHALDAHSDRIPYVDLGRELAPVAGDPSKFFFLRECLGACQSQHPDCTRGQDPSWYPTRLLRIVALDETASYVQLLDAKDCKPDTRYVALSHCWGDRSKMFRWTSRNVDQFPHRINVEELPRTFRTSYSWYRNYRSAVFGSMRFAYYKTTNPTGPAHRHS